MLAFTGYFDKNGRTRNMPDFIKTLN